MSVLSCGGPDVKIGFIEIKVTLLFCGKNTCQDYLELCRSTGMKE